MAPLAAESAMAQSAAAQREPSMEEILASIRRIIEDSDTARSDEAVTAIPVAANAPVSRDIEAYREDLSDEQESVEAQPAASFAEPASSASVSSFPAARDVTSREEPATATEEPAVEPQPATIEAESDDGELQADSLLTAEDLAAPSRVVDTARGSIISEAAGRQVAAAFDELSEALMASRRRSFDEIAEEMIRPMLQDWLDNNLPTLVERLVREEIERVARGAAR